MLNLKFIQENPELVITKLKKKHFDASVIVQQITELSLKKNDIQSNADQCKAEMNKISKEIGLLMRDGKTNEVQAAKDKIEISEEARNMAKTTEISPERLEQIRNRIDSKFYSSAEVLSKVADKILKEIK